MRRYNPIKWIAVLAVAVGGAWLFTVAARYNNTIRQRQHIHTALKSCALGLDNYDAIYKRLPEAVLRDATGQALASWRFRLSDFTQSTGPIPHYQDYAKPWNHPANAWFAQRSPSFYCADTSSTTSIVLAIVGKGTAFEEGRTYSLKDLDEDTILLVESANSNIHWMQPGDLDIETMPRTVNLAVGVGIAGIDPTVVHVLFADGMVWRLRSDVPFERLSAFFTVDGAKRNRRDELLGPYRFDSSY